MDNNFATSPFSSFVHNASRTHNPHSQIKGDHKNGEENC